ncbi:PilZ domain-containing protein [bacterium]|nr:PilZ domain-containing protein [bacterium]
MVKERRKFPRKRIKESLKLDSSESKQEGLIEAQTIDISKTGASCILSKYIPPFTKLKMMLSIPDTNSEINEQIECESVIVRVEPAITFDEEKKYKVALYFVDITEEYRQKLDKLLLAQA